MVNTAVIVEVIEGRVRDISYELLGKARELAESTGGNAVAVVIGNNVDVSKLPCDTVYYVEGERLSDFCSLHHRVLSKLIEEINPDVILAGNTSIGTDLAVRLAAEFEVPIASLCSDVSVKNGVIKATSLAYGGKLLVDLELKDKGVIIVNRGSFTAEMNAGNPEIKKMSLEEMGVELDDSIEFLGYIKPEEDIDISKFDVLVSVGRGIGGEENIEEARELAELLGGEISASRPVVDQEWLPKSRQVGRSGKTVTPNLYLALGISGASEHLEGVKAKNVIAINTDPDAPIFRVSRVGVVADIFDVLPVLIERIREIKG
ncbi:MAG TPA: electron transfer flavoprotein subunit alpha/FixB family protein [Archaeoglobaceae archaeon]|nr:electron transfer flavoprotein subunit alpha/FixB family protein [Archaeoglobaceae archaeon]